jgi:hypothetical protein
VEKDMAQFVGKSYSMSVSFKLLNDQGKDITNTILFPNRTQQEKEIEEEVFSESNSFQDAAESIKKEEIERFRQTAKLDSTKIKSLKNFFRVRKDEFSTTGKTWFKPKTAPKYTNRNGLYCYFQTEDNMPSNLRFRM